MCGLERLESNLSLNLAHAADENVLFSGGNGFIIVGRIHGQEISQERLSNSKGSNPGAAGEDYCVNNMCAKRASLSRS